MQDHVYAWCIINLTQRGRWCGAKQKYQNRLYRNHTTHWVLNSYVHSITGVTVASFKLAIMLYPQSYNLTWVLVDFLIGYVLVSGGVVVGKRGTCSPFFQFSNTKRCPFRRSLASYGLAAWLHLLGCVALSSLPAGTRVGSGQLGRGSPWLNARTGHGKYSLLGFSTFPCKGRGSSQRRRERERESGRESWERELCAL